MPAPDERTQSTLYIPAEKKREMGRTSFFFELNISSHIGGGEGRGRGGRRERKIVQSVREKKGEEW